MVGIRCVHYIEQKDYTARFATGEKVKQVDTSHTGRTVQPKAPLIYLLYEPMHCAQELLRYLKGQFHKNFVLAETVGV